MELREFFWEDVVKLDLSGWPALTEYRARLSGRPGVKKALTAEGLLK